MSFLPNPFLSYKCFKPYKAWEMLGKGEFWGHDYQGSSLFSPLLPPRTTEVLNPIKRQQAWCPNSQTSVPPQLMADIGETTQVSSGTVELGVEKVILVVFLNI